MQSPTITAPTIAQMCKVKVILLHQQLFVAANLVLTVSTSGASPALARKIKQDLAEQFDVYL
ncbi:hypothetical protein LSPH24S_00380 [Lysinibacillus sphaericus]